MDKPNDQSSRWSSESNYPPQVGSFLVKMSFNFVDLEQQLSMKVVICVGS